MSTENTLRLRAEEMDDLFALHASLDQFARARADMEKRLKLIPNGKRDMAMIMAVLDKLIDKIMKTIPPEKHSTLKRNMRRMCYQIYLAHPAVRHPEEIILSGPDLEVLTRYSHGYACLGCDKDCNKCELGKALDHVMIQCRRHNESWSLIDCKQQLTDMNAISVEGGRNDD